MLPGQHIKVWFPGEARELAGAVSSSAAQRRREPGHSCKMLFVKKERVFNSTPRSALGVTIYTLDRFTKTFFWNFQNSRADLCYILIYKQMLEKVFCSNIAPSLSSGKHLFYKAEYMGQSCPNQVWAITFDWSALAT